MEPTTISVFDTPCVWACAPAQASAAIVVRANAVLSVMSESPSLIHRFDAVGVLLLDEFALELHRRGEFFVFGGQLRFEQEEFLDLLDTRHLLVHALDLVPDELLDLRRLGEA